MSSRAVDAFARLLDIVATLNGPDGCPWDREQTIDSLKPFVLEETYEVLEAIDRQDHDALCEELGDFVFEAVFLAHLEEAAGRFGLADSLQAVGDKLVRRHPHVFARDKGEPKLDTPGQVRARWEEIKAEERRGSGNPGNPGSPGNNDKPKTLLSGIPATTPALLRAYHIGVRAKSVGFEWARAEDVVDKIEEEVAELREVVEGPALDQARAEEEMGDLLFSIAHLARKLGVEPETALRKANDKFTTRFTAMEQTIASSGRAMRDLSLEELEREWQRVKAEQQAG